MLSIIRLKKNIRNISKLYIFKFCNLGKENFVCPICNYKGPFIDITSIVGPRRHAKCPKCGALERHRIQKLVIDEISMKYDLSKMSILHFAPEPFFRKYFQKILKITRLLICL